MGLRQKQINDFTVVTGCHTTVAAVAAAAAAAAVAAAAAAAAVAIADSSAPKQLLYDCKLAHAVSTLLYYSYIQILLIAILATGIQTPIRRRATGIATLVGVFLQMRVA